MQSPFIIVNYTSFRRFAEVRAELIDYFVRGVRKINDFKEGKIVAMSHLDTFPNSTYHHT